LTEKELARKNINWNLHAARKSSSSGSSSSDESSDVEVETLAPAENVGQEGKNAPDLTWKVISFS